MLLFLPVILFLKYMFVKSPKFSLPLKKDYINLRSLEGSVLMYSRWRWGWGKVLWSMTFLHRSNLGRWCSWDLKLSNLSTSGSGKVSCLSQRAGCMGENICACAQLGWYRESAEIPATAVSPPLSLRWCALRYHPIPCSISMRLKASFCSSSPRSWKGSCHYRGLKVPMILAVPLPYHTFFHPCQGGFGEDSKASSCVRAACSTAWWSWGGFTLLPGVQCSC